MTETSDKIRSLFLTALMVCSVVGGTVAFAGSAAAATGVGNVSVSDTPVSEDSTVTHSNVQFDLEGLNGDSSDQSVEVTLYLTEGEIQGVSTVNGNPVSASNQNVQNGNLTFTLQGDEGTGYENTITLGDLDVAYPAVEGDTSTELRVDVDDTGGDDLDTEVSSYTIEESGASQAGAPDVRKATHYVDSTEGAIVEIAFTESVNADDPSIEVLDEDGNVVLDEGDIDSSATNLDNGRLVLGASGTINDVENVTVSGYEDDAGNALDETTVDVTFAPTTVDTRNDGADGVNDEAFQGAFVALEGQQGDEFQIEGLEDGNSDVDITRATGFGSQIYALDTDALDAGDYDIENTDAGTNRTLRLNDLGLSVDPDEETFQTDENVTATVESDAIDRPVDLDLVDEDGEVVEEVEVSIDADGNVEADLGQAEAGNYTITVEDVNTGVNTTSDEFSVVEAGDASVSFRDSVYTEEVGDVAEIVVELENTDTATIQVGDYTNDNYNITAEIEDGDGDGRVTVQFNSYTAGVPNSGGSDAPSTTVLTVADSDDEIRNVSQGGTFTGANDPLGDNVLEDSDYDVLLEQGDKDASVVESEEAVATLNLRERSTEAARVWTAPENDLDDLDEANASEVYGYIASDELTQTSTVAQSDAVVVEVEASGLEGVLAATGADTTPAYLSRSGATYPFSLTVEQVEDEANAVSSGINVDALDDNDVSVVYDDANETHFVVLDSDAVTEEFDHESGDEYVANFTVYDDSELSEDNVTVNDTFGVEDRDATLNGGNDVTVSAADNQTISGTTNLAPGSEVTVRVEDDEDDTAFLKQPTAIVQPDGTFVASTSFTDVSLGTNFTAQTRISANDVGDAIDGRVVQGPVASVIVTDQESDGETVTVDSVTLSEGGFVAIHLNNASGDVIGASEYLESGTHEDVEITLDSTRSEDFTAVAMPHLDTDGDETYDFPDNDGPYTANGSAVTDDAAITVIDDTTETTEPPTTEPTTEPPTTEPTTEPPTTEPTTEPPTTEPTTEPPTTEPTDASGPGFTAVLALVALLAAALLAARRND
ncbi:DUF7282 domain-containing protein [Haloarcula litorea]|uniref:DUF7282 domain-containing protein n=1 Tax=Haloarcula litorea TaxID=3032579 RepID=UPI0023E8A275|nr:BGTF surface domain-containing protein [Halomicroarcula sp. GDY20]